MRASPSSAQGRYLDTVDNSKVDIYVDTVDIYTEKCMSSPLHGLLSPLLLQLIAVKKCHEMDLQQTQATVCCSLLTLQTVNTW